MRNHIGIRIDSPSNPPVVSGRIKIGFRRRCRTWSGIRPEPKLEPKARQAQTKDQAHSPETRAEGQGHLFPILMDPARLRQLMEERVGEARRVSGPPRLS